MKKVFIQIGDKPGFQKLCLNVMVKNESISIPITKKIANKLKKLGVGSEG